MAAKTLQQIPMLSGATITGHASEFQRDRLGLFVRAAREHGDICAFRFFNKTVLVVSSPEILHEMHNEKARSFGKSVGNRTDNYPCPGEGLLTSDGDLWKRKRNIMAPHSTSRQRARARKWRIRGTSAPDRPASMVRLRHIPTRPSSQPRMT